MMSLVDCYLPVFRLALEFLTVSDSQWHADYEQFRTESLARIEKAAREAEKKHDPDDCTNALFAVVVWFDEQVLCSPLPWVTKWRSAMLQTHLFQTSVGGELFFERLDGIKNNTPVRIVFLYCLLLGFHGKYIGQDNDILAQRIKDERTLLPSVWQTWPNNASITPSQLPEHKGKRRPLTHCMRSGKLLSFIVVASYVLLFLGLMAYLL